MKFDNYMILEFPSRSSNEAFARSAVACFAAQTANIGSLLPVVEKIAKHQSRQRIVKFSKKAA